MTPPADPRIRGYLDALAEAIAEELLREINAGTQNTTAGDQRAQDPRAGDYDE